VTAVWRVVGAFLSFYSSFPRVCRVCVLTTWMHHLTSCVVWCGWVSQSLRAVYILYMAGCDLAT